MFLSKFLKMDKAVWWISQIGKKVKEWFKSKMSVRRPPFKLKVNQGVAVQNPQKTSVRAKKLLKGIFCGTPCICPQLIGFFMPSLTQMTNGKIILLKAWKYIFLLLFLWYDNIYHPFCIIYNISGFYHHKNNLSCSLLFEY